MVESLIERFQLAQNALSTAIERNYEGAISYFDQQLSELFQQILDASPATTTSRSTLCAFLLEYCCSTCEGKSLSQLAKRRILQLV